MKHRMYNKLPPKKKQNYLANSKTQKFKVLDTSILYRFTRFTNIYKYLLVSINKIINQKLSFLIALS